MQQRPQGEKTALAQGHIGCSCAGCVKGEQITRRSKGDRAILTEEGQGPRKRERLSTRDSVASGTQPTPGQGPSTIQAQSGMAGLAGQASGQQLTRGFIPTNSPTLVQRDSWNRGLNNSSERSSPMFFAQSRTQQTQVAQPTQPTASTRAEQAIQSPQQRQTFERAPQAQPTPPQPSATVTPQTRIQQTQAAQPTASTRTVQAIPSPQQRQTFERAPQAQLAPTVTAQIRTQQTQPAATIRTEQAIPIPQQRQTFERAPQAQPAPTLTPQVRTHATQASPTARTEVAAVALQPRQATGRLPQAQSSPTAPLQSRTPPNQGARAVRTENAAVSLQQRQSNERPSPVQPVRAANPQSHNQSLRLKPEAAPERAVRAVSQKGELSPKPVSVRQRSAEAHARKLQAAALERRKIEVLGKVQRILERTASARLRGLPLSELMRLEVVSQVVELLEGDEYFGVSDRRLHSRLSKMSRLNRTRIRGNSLKKDQERELKNKEKGSRQGPESQQASTSGSQMLSGTQAGKASVVMQKISSAKTTGPSKSLDIFQAKTDDDGDESDLLL